MDKSKSKKKLSTKGTKTTKKTEKSKKKKTTKSKKAKEEHIEGMFGIHEKDEPKAKGSGKNHNKKKEDKIQKEIEYTDKERSYINKYLKIAKTAYDEKEIYEIIKKYNFDDDLINKDIKKQLNMIQVKGEEYGWSEVKKKEIKPKTEITNTNNEKETKRARRR